MTTAPIDYNPPECCSPPVTLDELWGMYALLWEIAGVVYLVVYLVNVWRARS